MKRILGLISWLRAFIFIFQNRGKNTYGKDTIIYLAKKYILEFSMPLSDYEAAEKLVQELNTWCIPKKSWHLERVGRETDGGYWIPKGLSFELLISGGVGKNNDFEFYYAERGCKVIAFDPTIKKLPRPHANIELRRVWLKGNSNERNSETLQKVIQGNTLFNGIMVKLDIEGDEYDVILNSLDALAAVDALVIEFHDLYKLCDPAFAADIREIMQEITSRFSPVSFSSNNWRNHVQFGFSFVPEVFEVVFVANGLMKNLTYEQGLPVENKCANNPNRLRIPNLPFSVRQVISQDVAKS